MSENVINMKDLWRRCCALGLKAKEISTMFDISLSYAYHVLTGIREPKALCDSVRGVLVDYFISHTTNRIEEINDELNSLRDMESTMDLSKMSLSEVWHLAKRYGIRAKDVAVKSNLEYFYLLNLLNEKKKSKKQEEDLKKMLGEMISRALVYKIHDLDKELMKLERETWGIINDEDPFKKDLA